MIDGKMFYELKMIQEHMIAFEKNAIAQPHDYTTGYLPDYLYFEKYYKIIAIYLRKQQKLDADPNTIKQKHFS